MTERLRRALTRVLPYAVACFATLHIAAVVVDLVPYPTHTKKGLEKYDDARIELDGALRPIHAALGQPGTFPEFRRRALRFGAAYTGAVVAARELVGHYLELVASQQKWNMFGGVPPTRPIVLDVEVRARCKGKFKKWLEGRAGGSGDVLYDFRHRKAQETLFLGQESALQNYARYWMRRWERAHHGRHPVEVRVSYMKTWTPAPSARFHSGSARWERVGGTVVRSRERKCKK